MKILNSQSVECRALSRPLAETAKNTSLLLLLSLIPVLTSNASAADNPVVTVLRAGERHIVRKVTVIGTIVPRETVDVGVDLNGFRISEVDAEEGNHVAAGQVLVRLSTETLLAQIAQNDASIAHGDAAIDQAKSQIAEAAAVEVEAEAAFRRSQVLKTKGAVSQEALEQRSSAADQAEARRRAAEQALAVVTADRALAVAKGRELAVNLARATIRAPTDGIILTRTARMGSVISASGMPLFTIARNGIVEFSAEVDESVLQRAVVGQAVAVTPTGEERPIKGSIRAIYPTVDLTTRLGTLRVSLPDNGSLRSGGYARGEIDVADEYAVALPPTSIVSAGGEQVAKVVVNNRVETRKLVTGISDGANVAVRAGISAGDQVILRSATFVHDGQSVRTVMQPSQENGQ